MGFRLRQIEEGSKFIQHLTMDALCQVVPNDVVLAVLEAEGLKTKRERKLNLMVMVYVVIGMGLFPALRIGNVMNKLAKGLRYIWEDPDIAIPGDSALSYRRDQLGARPIVELFRRICRPIATPETPGAFLFGLRVAWPLTARRKIWRIALKMQRPMVGTQMDEAMLRIPKSKAPISWSVARVP